ncbi:MAG: UDP-4-amino-4,6-dideoxy-N-acetyl-beta-L-altrosamine N-acetyltransferase, partial [Candidatus Omnitrophota bacterium]|nr:UDP-4-amino-4,6-dideoxy-N-acetyl-beta-L-altrosamine N-acetyltransferase [Candidatus Omnitrophota bacterium]
KKNFYWLAKHASNEYLGVIYLNEFDIRNKHAYLGIYTNPDSGFKGRMLMECLKWLSFNKAKLHTIKLEVIKKNKKALRFYKKSGFEIEGYLKEFIFRNKRWQDVIVMGLIE